MVATALDIAEVYGGGGNSGSTYRNDYVIIHNLSNAAISLSGYSLQYNSAAGTGAWIVSGLSGAVQAGGYFLVQEAPGAGGTTTLPTPDATGTLALSATAGKIALVNTTNALTGANPAGVSIVDLVGYGATATGFETAPTAGTANGTGITRGNFGNTDSDNNSTDFSVVAIDASYVVRNSASTPHPASPAGVALLSVNSISLAEGNSGLTSFDFTITRGGDTTGTTSVNYATSDGTAKAGSDYTAASGSVTFGAGETIKTVSVVVNGDTTPEPTETFNVMLSGQTGGASLSQATGVGTIVNDDITVLGIATIQGASQTSPYAGQSVSTQGIVTAIKTGAGGGFYIQDATDTGPAGASHGLFIFSNATPMVAVGDAVTVSGMVSEYNNPALSNFANNLPITEIDSPTVTVGTHNNAVTPIIIGGGGILPPTGVISPGQATINGAAYDPAHNGLDFYESLEGQIVTVKNAQAVDSTYQGSTWVVTDNGASATGINARGGITISAGDFNPERIQIYNPSGSNYTMGDHLGDVTGVVTYYNGNYELIPTAPVAAMSQGTLAKPATTLVGDASHLSFGDYNVMTFDPGDTARIPIVAHDIVDGLGSPDIISLEEIEDGDGAGSGANLSGAPTLQALINAIAAAGGPTYQYVEIAPTSPNSTGGEPGGNIRNAFLYNASRVTYEAGSAQLINDSTLGSGNTRNADAFYNSRHPLEANFDFNGQVVTAISVHNYSRGGSQELFGVNQPATNNGDDVRLDQSNSIADWINAYKASHPGANIVTAGDFNAFYFEPSLQVLTTSSGLTNLVQLQPANERYSSEFEGDAEQIDNLLVSSNLAPGAQFQTIHRNTGQAAADQGSDHDPIVSLLAIGSALVAKSDSYVGSEDVNLTVDATHGVLANDTGVSGHALTATLVQGPAHGTLAFNTDGSFTYRGAQDYNGTDTFSYTVQDDTGATSTAASVSLNIAAVNDAPKITASAPSAILVEAGTAGPGTPMSIVSLAPSDVDSVVQYNLAKWTMVGDGLYSQDGIYGSVQLDTAHNLLTYTLDNSRGKTDSLAEGAHVKEAFIVTVTDGALAAATIVGFAITGSSDAPAMSSLHSPAGWAMA